MTSLECWSAKLYLFRVCHKKLIWYLRCGTTLSTIFTGIHKNAMEWAIYRKLNGLKISEVISSRVKCWTSKLNIRGISCFFFCVEFQLSCTHVISPPHNKAVFSLIELQNTTLEHLYVLTKFVDRDHTISHNFLTTCFVSKKLKKNLS